MTAGAATRGSEAEAPLRAAPRRRAWLSASQPARALVGPRGDLALTPLLAAYVTVTLLAAPGSTPIHDEPAWLDHARQLLHGHYAVSGMGVDAPVHFLWHGPGLPLLLVPFVAVGAPLWAMRLLGPLFLFVALVMFRRLLGLRLEPRAALAGAYALGLYPPFFTVLSFLHKEPLALALVTTAAYGLARALRDGRPRFLALAGAALGWLVLTRVEYGWVLVALLVIWVVVWLLGRDRVRARRLVTVHILALAMCVPWLAYTHAVTGRTLYWGNAGGLSLYWMSDPRHLGEWHGLAAAFSDPRLAAERPLFRRLERMDLVQRDDELTRIAATQARAHPGAYARNVGANITRMWFGFPFSGMPAAARALYAVINAVLLAALIVAALAWRRRRPRGPVVPEALPLALFAALGLAIHLLPSAEPRHLIPLIPLLVWPVVHAAWRRA